MAFSNLKFPFINLRFGVFFGVIYMLFGWFVGTSDAGISSGSGSFITLLADAGLSDISGVSQSIGALLMGSPGLTLFLAFLFAGILAFADTERKKPLSSWIAGGIHGAVQVILLLLGVWLTSYLVLGVAGLAANSFPGIILSALLLALCGWLFSGFAMGIYLLSTTLLLATHETEAFSSFRGEDHKNFVRMHLTAEGLTIYPIKIPKVYKQWKQAEKTVKGEDPWFTPQPGDDVDYGLIEGPITIKST